MSLILFLFWTCFWSFSTVLVERWHSWKSWIMTGRSECPKCNHILSFSELFPIFSYIFQWGKCKNCKSPISPFYPLAEVFMGILFMLCGWIAGNFWYTPLDTMWWGFIVLWFITGVYMIYDIKYMEIPDQVMIPGIIWMLSILILGYFFDSWNFYFDENTYPTYQAFFGDHLRAAFFAYTFFFIQILIPGGYHFLKKWQWKNFLLLLLQFFTFPISIIIDFFEKSEDSEEEESIPTWMGGWDLRIAIFIGLTLGTVHTSIAIIGWYIAGSIYGIYILIKKKIEHKRGVTLIPFWPFLWIWWIFALSYHEVILKFFENLI